MRGVMTRGVLAAAALVASATMGPAAAAAPLERLENTVDELSCVFETVEGDLVFFFASADDEGSGSGMFVEDPQGGLVLVGDGGSAAFGPTFTAEVPLVELGSGTSVGSGTVAATLRPAGEPRVEEIRERSGNAWTTGTMTTTDYVVEATSVSVPGYTVVPEPGDCSGSRIVFDVRTTNPAAQVYRDTSFGSGICTLEGLAGGQVRLSGTGLEAAVFEVVVETADDVLKASGDLDLRGRGGSASAPLVSLLTGQAVGDLAIDVELERAGRRGQESLREGSVTERVSWVPYRLTIDVQLPDGRAGSTTCPGELVTSTAILRPGKE